MAIVCCGALVIKFGGIGTQIRECRDHGTVDLSMSFICFCDAGAHHTKTTFPKGSFVDLLHPEHNTEVMGKERFG